MVKSPIFRFSRFGETANRKVISQSSSECLPRRLPLAPRKRTSPGAYPLNFPLFTVPVSSASFREIHDRHRDVDPVHIAFRIHADRAAVIRGVRRSSGHRRNALIDMFASASGIECKTRFRFVVTIASAEHIHLIGHQNLEDILIRRTHPSHK